MCGAYSYKKKVHMLTTNDVQGTLGDVWIYVEALGFDLLLQLVDQDLTLL
jgi:hypothetical protein